MYLSVDLVVFLLQWIVTKIQEQITKLKNWADSDTNSIVAGFGLEWNVSVSCLDLLKSYFAVLVLVQILSVAFSVLLFFFFPILPSSVLNKCDVWTNVLRLTETHKTDGYDCTRHGFVTTNATALALMRTLVEWNSCGLGQRVFVCCFAFWVFRGRNRDCCSDVSGRSGCCGR